MIRRTRWCSPVAVRRFTTCSTSSAATLRCGRGRRGAREWVSGHPGRGRQQERAERWRDMAHAPFGLSKSPLQASKANMRGLPCMRVRHARPRRMGPHLLIELVADRPQHRLRQQLLRGNHRSAGCWLRAGPRCSAAVAGYPGDGACDRGQYGTACAAVPYTQLRRQASLWLAVRHPLSFPRRKAQAGMVSDRRAKARDTKTIRLSFSFHEFFKTGSRFSTLAFHLVLCRSTTAAAAAAAGRRAAAPLLRPQSPCRTCLCAIAA